MLRSLVRSCHLRTFTPLRLLAGFMACPMPFINLLILRAIINDLGFSMDLHISDLNHVIDDYYYSPIKSFFFLKFCSYLSYSIIAIILLGWAAVALSGLTTNGFYIAAIRELCAYKKYGR